MRCPFEGACYNGMLLTERECVDICADLEMHRWKLRSKPIARVSMTEEESRTIEGQWRKDNG